MIEERKATVEMRRQSELWQRIIEMGSNLVKLQIDSCIFLVNVGLNLENKIKGDNSFYLYLYKLYIYIYIKILIKIKR